MHKHARRRENCLEPRVFQTRCSIRPYKTQRRELGSTSRAESLSNQRLLRTSIQYDLPVCDDCMQQLTVRFSSWEKLFYRFFCFFSFFKYAYKHPRRWFASSLLTSNFYRLSIFSVTSSFFEVRSPSRILVHTFSPNFQNYQSPSFVRCSFDISGFDTLRKFGLLVFFSFPFSFFWFEFLSVTYLGSLSLDLF